MVIVRSSYALLGTPVLASNASRMRNAAFGLGLSPISTLCVPSVGASKVHSASGTVDARTENVIVVVPGRSRSRLDRGMVNNALSADSLKERVPDTHSRFALQARTTICPLDEWL